ncbi:hypothetical protein HWV07_09250 [Natronomonas salina]|uniref:DUF7350 domain-containing protein n=1 Tax=Natronomonas salina TaxID=1710540 RepID=UPI0015B70B67|nr:hypothetical protein [Natronomonas salina]QLD89207.1 hypothetical protein HWV07_09250 [Natronomonas salina]
MDRRQYLQACLGAGTAAGLAGCTDLGFIETQELPSTPPVLEDRPDRVYHPTHVDGMEMVGQAESDNGDYGFALVYTYPHRFWRVDATTESVDDAILKDPDGSQDVHLMSVLWDPQTGRTLPDAGMSVDIRKDGEALDEQVIYPMLSPRMGFHFGANFQLDGDGDYEIALSVGGTSIRQTGDYQGRFGEQATVTVPFEFSTEERDNIGFERTEDEAGEASLPPVMDMDVPLGVAPDPAELPGTHHGTAESGDARLEVVSMESPPAGIDGDGAYLAVSARTPYNQLVLPQMALDATLDRDGQTVFEGALERTFDSDLGYHYGAAVDDVASGDALTIDVVTHPQVARHEGYETAFLQMPAAELTL